MSSRIIAETPNNPGRRQKSPVSAVPIVGRSPGPPIGVKISVPPAPLAQPKREPPRRPDPLPLIRRPARLGLFPAVCLAALPSGGRLSMSLANPLVCTWTPVQALFLA